MHSKHAVPKRRILTADPIVAAAVLGVTSTAHAANDTDNADNADSADSADNTDSADVARTWFDAGSTIHRAMIANGLKEFNAEAETVKQAAARAKSA